MQRLISRYRQSPEIGWSAVEVLDARDHRVLAHVCRKDEWSLVALHNFAAEPVEVTVEVPGLTRGTGLVDLLTPGRPQRIEAGPRGRITADAPGVRPSSGGASSLEGDRRIDH